MLEALSTAGLALLRLVAESVIGAVVPGFVDWVLKRDEAGLPVILERDFSRPETAAGQPPAAHLGITFRNTDRARWQIAGARLIAPRRARIASDCRPAEAVTGQDLPLELYLNPGAEAWHRFVVTLPHDWRGGRVTVRLRLRSLAGGRTRNAWATAKLD